MFVLFIYFFVCVCVCGGGGGGCLDYSKTNEQIFI